MGGERLWTKDFIFVLLTAFFSAMTNSLLMSTFPLYIKSLGGDNGVSGIMITVQLVAMAATRLVSGRLQDRFGRRLMLIIGGFSYLATTVSYIFIRDITVIYVIRFLNGISQGIYFGAAATIVADVVPKERLVDGVLYFGAATALAMSFSPMLGIWVFNNQGVLILFIYSAVIALAGALSPLFIQSKRASKRHRGKEHNCVKSTKKILRGIYSFVELSVVIPSVVWMLVVVGHSTLTNFLTDCGVERGIKNTGLFFIFSSIAVIAVRVVTGKLAKRVSISVLIATGIALFVVSVIMVSFARSVVLIIVAGAVSGFGFGVVAPLIGSLIFRFVPNERKGVGNATYGLFNDIGMGIGGLFGFVTQSFGYTVMYLIAAGFVTAGGIVHLFLLTKKIKQLDSRSKSPTKHS